MEQYDHFAGSRLLSLDLASGQLRQLDAFSPEELFRCTAVTPGGDLLLMTTDKAHLASEAMGDQYARTPGVSRLYGYRDGQRLWAAETTTYAYTPLCALEPLGEYGLLWLVDDRLFRLDPDTGRELAACPLGSPPVWLEAGPESASLLLADGSAGSYSYRSGQFTARRCCAGPLQTGLGDDALLAVPENSPRILLYGYLRDENWQPLPGESPGAGQNYQVRDSRIVLQGLDGLVMLDTAAQTRLWELPGADPYGSSLLGFSADGQEVWLADHRNVRLLRLDARTGTAQPVSLPDQAQGLPLTWEGPDAWPQTDGQRVFLLAQGQNGDTGGLFLAVWDSATGRTSVQPVGSQPAAGSRLLGARNGTAWLWNAADQTVCRVEADGTVQVLLQQVTEPPAARVLDESGLLALCQADRVLLFEENGPPRTLYTDGRRPVDCRLQDGVLLVLTGEATLLRLDPAEGRVLGETELEVYETYFSRFDSRYHTSRIHWEMVDEDTRRDLRGLHPARLPPPGPGHRSDAPGDAGRARAAALLSGTGSLGGRVPRLPETGLSGIPLGVPAHAPSPALTPPRMRRHQQARQRGTHAGQPFFPMHSNAERRERTTKSVPGVFVVYSRPSRCSSSSKSVTICWGGSTASSRCRACGTGAMPRKGQPAARAASRSRTVSPT